MPSESSAPLNHEPAQLPPVQPPSAKFLVQLFVVPALIVIGVLIPVVFLVRGCAKSPDELLNELRSGNADVRWRAAEQLAQVLPRDREEAMPRFAYNVKFSLDMTELLQKVLQEEDTLLKQIGTPPSSEKVKDNKALDEHRKLIQFLLSSSGNFNIPIPAPVLSRVATTDKGLDPRILHERRQLALLALANLGANLDDYDRLSEERKQGILADLEGAANSDDKDKQELARLALDFLKDKMPLGVEKALIECSEADDPLVREAAALALGYWKGNEGEKALLRLARDDGHGGHLNWEKANEKDEDLLTQDELQDRYRLEIRYHALLSLARLGSNQFPEWIDDFADMLDEEKQLMSFQIKMNGKYVPDQDRAHMVVLKALRVIPCVHDKRPDMDLTKLDPALLKLTESPNFSLKEEAKRTRKALGLTQ